jgi:hypothetical protein
MALEKFKNDLKAFHQSWELISRKSSLLEDRAFLLKLAKEIQNLHHDIGTNRFSKKVKETALLIDYILDTPWGAPFVFEKPLLEAAISFQENGSSDFHDLIGQFLNFKDEINHQLFDYVGDIEKTLADYEP